MGRVVPEYAGVKYRRIEKEGLQTPVWDDDHPGTPYLFTDTFPSGKGKFHPLEYVPSVEMPDEEYPFILTTGRLLEHWHGGTLTREALPYYLSALRRNEFAYRGMLLGRELPGMTPVR